MEVVEIFTILERAKMKCLANICKEGNRDQHQEVLCEERSYEVLSQVTSDIIDTLGPEIIPLYNAVTELVMKEEGRGIVHPQQTSNELPEDARAELDKMLKDGVLDVPVVSTFPRGKSKS